MNNKENKNSLSSASLSLKRGAAKLITNNELAVSPAHKFFFFFAAFAA